ncbi:class I SAM-dependent RNA methyltransferase [Zhihengliuella salsuginis]|uniref:RNA methyltransferase n=1 Tax=Zhihengliuella salsuginis TaxID=578222 RepID=A0ABQ3GCC7_9MICC|nr:TRAM domain-containing protein [Zhihengliuella salsuginis]GHD01225.1 putative RNA methyltransferase [Zhihengliuella salsuginis]
MNQPAAPEPAPVVELTIGPVAHGGHFVARHQGRVVFVRHALPGERVLARLTEHDDGARFWRADVVDVLDASADRQDHVWDQADALAAARSGRPAAGGAEFGHIRLEAQRRLKGEVFAEHLERAASIDVSALGFAGVEAAGEEDGLGRFWRTRMAFAVDADGRLAMHPHRSDDLVALSSMPLASEEIQRLSPWDADFSGFERVEIAAPAGGDETLVLLVPSAAAADAAGVRRAARRVASQLPDSASVSVLTQEGGAAADGRGALQRISGRTWLSESVELASGDDYQFRVTGEGFWQIHRAAPATLTDAVLGIVAPEPGQTVADLYAGAGLFTLPLAERVGSGGRVLSIEGAPGTSKDARRNLHEHRQAVIAQGRVERTLRGQLQRLSGGRGTRRLDAVVLDPPRAGAGKRAVELIAQAQPATIAYVSCDPASFARDAADLRRRGYELVTARVFDLYPNTHHLETVGHFARA